MDYYPSNLMQQVVGWTVCIAYKYTNIMNPTAFKLAFHDNCTLHDPQL